MEDKELVEVWRKEFESLMSETFPHRSLEKENGHYIDRDVFYWLAGFLMAKRCQPAITVPAYDMHHSAPVRNLMAKMDSAGIKYTIGE